MKTIYLSNGESLQKAINFADENSIIVLEPREYREKVKIAKSNITLQGVKNKTKIVFDDYARKIHSDGLEYITFRTQTVTVTGNNVAIKDLEIENDSYLPTIKGQAVALSVYGDNFLGENLVLRSMQDTLFLGPLPDDLTNRYNGFLPSDERYVEGELLSLFTNCDIYGSVDYVFGCGNAYFYNCKLINIDDNRAIGYVCAPAHSLKQRNGFNFYKCSFEKANDLNAEVFLARPWRDYGKCEFLDCEIDSHISPLGFNKWGDTYRDTTARFLYGGFEIKNAVSWATRLSPSQREKLIDNFNLVFKKFNIDL